MSMEKSKKGVVAKLDMDSLATPPHTTTTTTTNTQTRISGTLIKGRSEGKGLGEEYPPQVPQKGQTLKKDSPKDKRKGKASKEDPPKGEEKEEKKEKSSQEDSPPNPYQTKRKRRVRTPSGDPSNPKATGKAKPPKKKKTAREPSSEEDENFLADSSEDTSGPSFDSYDSEDLAGTRDVYLQSMPSIKRQQEPRTKKQQVGKFWDFKLDPNIEKV